ncbi:MAG: tRNA pseudouridine(55) synthase TruB [Ignavibacteriae bacterium]|nr:MAG: tRNA pseudouridine(55) synthase TruB [Ignavibacteriota bacterium]
MNDEQVLFHDFSVEGEVLFLDKPLHWTSFDVVKKVRALFDVRKVGRAGTLDPHATGLLIVCTGKKTKSIEQFVGLEKEYTGTCKIGERTPSFDTETEAHEWRDSSSVSEMQIHEAAHGFIGKQLQLPPMYSAVKYGGKPLYKYARKGKTVERVEREIDVSCFAIESVRGQFVDFCIVCSKGTYIRSLIDEWGMRLGCGATLTALRRTRIGEHRITEAMTMDQLIDWRNSISLLNKSSHDSGSAN